MTIGRGAEAFGITQRGPRFANEDDFRIHRGPSGLVCVVADGMGGHAAGDVASRLAVTITSSLLVAPDEGAAPDRIRAAVEVANREIFEQSTSNPMLRGMGSTIALLYLPHEGNVAHVAHVGDSRVYLHRDGALRPLTEDHTLGNYFRANADKFAELGANAADIPEHANILMSALGIKETVDVTLTEVEVCPGDLFLLCTDGLPAVVDDTRLAELLREGGDDVEGTCRRLLAETHGAPGTDRTDGPRCVDDVALIVARVLTCAPSRT